MKTLIIILVLFGTVYSDTPANCTYEDIKGAWKIYEGPRGQSKFFDCTNYTNLSSTYYIYLDFPDIATDDQGNEFGNICKTKNVLNFYWKKNKATSVIGL